MANTTWRKLALGEVVTLQRGYDLPHKERKHGTVPIISSSGSIDTHNESRAPGPGVVTGRYGTIGEVFFISEDFWPLNTTLFVKDFKGNNPLFISFLLRTIDYQSYSGKSGVPGVNRNDLHEISVCLPPLPEQQAIATALSDVDALITSLDKLIAKKRVIKQATMQQLLTGKRRLPGFNAEWEVRKIGEIADIVSGGTPSTIVAKFWHGDIKWCTPTDITRTRGKYLTNTEKYISEAGLKYSSANLLPIGSLLMCSRATIGEVKIAASIVCTNQGFKSLICSKEVNNEFLYYVILTIKPKLIEKAIGSTFLEISKKDTASLEIALPSLPEQQAIATVLADMDAEIVALERRRDKTCALKQGMMQELLTGKTRII